MRNRRMCSTGIPFWRRNRKGEPPVDGLLHLDMWSGHLRNQNLIQLSRTQRHHRQQRRRPRPQLIFCVRRRRKCIIIHRFTPFVRSNFRKKMSHLVNNKIILESQWLLRASHWMEQCRRGPPSIGESTQIHSTPVKISSKRLTHIHPTHAQSSRPTVPQQMRSISVKQHSFGKGRKIHLEIENFHKMTGKRYRYVARLDHLVKECVRILSSAQAADKFFDYFVILFISNATLTHTHTFSVKTKIRIGLEETQRQRTVRSPFIHLLHNDRFGAAFHK